MNFLKLAIAAGLIFQAAGAAQAAQTYRANVLSHDSHVLNVGLRLIELPWKMEADESETR